MRGCLSNMDEEILDPNLQFHIVSEAKPNPEDINTYYYQYAVSSQWYKTWKKYIGQAEGKRPGQTKRPGQVEMIESGKAENEYVDGHIWIKLIKWYGLAENHHCDRRFVERDGIEEKNIHLYKEFELCVLSPMLHMIEFSNLKYFDIREYVGYIELQMRKIFKVKNHKDTRLWIRLRGSEKFTMLADRAEEFQYAYGIEEDQSKCYTLALEICSDDNSWPSGSTEQPQGSLEEFWEVTEGSRSDNLEQWEKELASTLVSSGKNDEDSVKVVQEKLVRTANKIVGQKLNLVERLKRDLAKKNNQVDQHQQKLQEERARCEVAQRDLEVQSTELSKEVACFEKEQECFYQELHHMEEMNRITESVVKLNVGGHIFTTSVQTLTMDPDSMLAAIFSCHYELKTDASGAVFIDRDGTYFRYILNYLRNGQISKSCLPEGEHIVHNLLVEANFYQIQGLIDGLNSILNPPDPDPGIQSRVVKPCTITFFSFLCYICTITSAYFKQFFNAIYVRR